VAAIDPGSLNPMAPSHDEHQEFVQRSPILMIGRDPTLMVYKAAVLGTASLAVDTALPGQALTILEEKAPYNLVILSHTLEPDEALHIRNAIRARNLGTKLLLMLGPRGTPLNYELFDATLRGLDGPAALIAKVQQLLDREPAPAANGSCCGPGQ
jgi:hypothetical protein